MSRAAIYTVNESSQTVAEDGVINLGTIVRKFGCNLNLAGTGIQIMGPGYYRFDSSITLAPDAAGNITVTAYLDNMPVQGAVATAEATAAGDILNLDLDFIIRQSCPCCEGLSNLVFKVSENAADVSNIAIVGEKL
jgi:hypothetical protein